MAQPELQPANWSTLVAGGNLALFSLLESQLIACANTLRAEGEEEGDLTAADAATMLDARGIPLSVGHATLHARVDSFNRSGQHDSSAASASAQPARLSFRADGSVAAPASRTALRTGEEAGTRGGASTQQGGFIRTREPHPQAQASIALPGLAVDYRPVQNFVYSDEVRAVLTDEQGHLLDQTQPGAGQRVLPFNEVEKSQLKAATLAYGQDNQYVGPDTDKFLFPFPPGWKEQAKIEFPKEIVDKLTQDARTQLAALTPIRKALRDRTLSIAHRHDSNVRSALKTQQEIANVFDRFREAIIRPVDEDGDDIPRDDPAVYLNGVLDNAANTFAQFGLDWEKTDFPSFPYDEYSEVKYLLNGEPQYLLNSGIAFSEHQNETRTLFQTAIDIAVPAGAARAPTQRPTVPQAFLIDAAEHAKFNSALDDQLGAAKRRAARQQGNGDRGKRGRGSGGRARGGRGQSGHRRDGNRYNPNFNDDRYDAGWIANGNRGRANGNEQPPGDGPDNAQRGRGRQ